MGIEYFSIIFCVVLPIVCITLVKMKKYESNRPAPEKRKFTSKSVENIIKEVKSNLKNRELAWLFENCFPNTSTSLPPS